ncbi:MAG TPA: hypothetical protein VH105_05045 [Burkholderiales bacterium]|jgi:hypothetical protein|nr:hypothetical protein [Burkholderiales bacterium]
MQARFVRPCFALALGLACAAGWAQTQAPPKNGIYTCRDANGKILTSDRPLPECQGREQRILGKDGTTIQVIPATLTDEQKAAREVELAKKKQEDDRRREQFRKDKALLNTYENADDIDSKRQRALQQVEREARESEKRMNQLEKQGADNAAEAEFYKKKAMPADLRRRIDENEAAARAEKLLYASKRDEVAQVNLKFDEDKKRYLDLTTGNATPGSAPTPLGAPAAKK